MKLSNAEKIAIAAASKKILHDNGFKQYDVVVKTVSHHYTQSELANLDASDRITFYGDLPTLLYEDYTGSGNTKSTYDPGLTVPSTKLRPPLHKPKKQFDYNDEEKLLDWQWTGFYRYDKLFSESIAWKGEGSPETIAKLKTYPLGKKLARKNRLFDYITWLARDGVHEGFGHGTGGMVHTGGVGNETIMSDAGITHIIPFRYPRDDNPQMLMFSEDQKKLMQEFNGDAVNRKAYDNFSARMKGAPHTGGGAAGPGEHDTQH